MELKSKVPTCDVCGLPLRKGKIKRYSLRELKPKKDTLTGERRIWLNPRYEILEKSNPEFIRKSRLCNECRP